MPFDPKAFDPRQPYNTLPELPPAADIESKPLLKACIEARAALAALTWCTLPSLCLAQGPATQHEYGHPGMQSAQEHRHGNSPNTRHGAGQCRHR
jgi:hypothetical protein